MADQVHTCPNRRLTETYLNAFPLTNPNSNPNPNPKAQRRFRENEMMSFFEQVSRYPVWPLIKMHRLIKLLPACRYFAVFAV